MDSTNNTIIASDIDPAAESASLPMQGALMSQNGQLSELWLPDKLSGKYCFPQIPGMKPVLFVSIQAIDGRWCAVCTGSAFFQEEFYSSSGSGTPANRGQVVPLVDRGICQINVDGDLFTLYSENSNEESNIFHAYTIVKNTDITIGRMESNDICIDSRFRFVSRRHAILSWRQDGLHILDWDSRNGVFLNNMAVKDQLVQIGDTIFLMGLRIVIGAGFIAMNDGNSRIKSYSKKVHRTNPELCKKYSYLIAPSGVGPQQKLFNRTPRRRSALKPKKISIEAPPMTMSGNGLPLFLRLGGSAVMGGSAALAGNYTMLLTSVLFPFMSQKYTEKEKKEYEERRHAKYTEYLESKRGEIEEERLREERILKDNYPDTSSILNYATFERNHLWERRPVDDDFLTLRLGSGEQAILSELEYPAQRFNLDKDELEDQMYALAEAKYTLKNIPILLNTIKYHLIGLVGSRQSVIAYLRQLIAQITMLHSCDEVKIVLLLEPSELEQIEYVKYIPHTWDDEKNIRFIAVSPGETGAIGEYIKNSMEDCLARPEAAEALSKNRPYFFIIATNKRLFDNMEVLKDILRHDANCGASLVAAMEELPKECSIQIELDDYGNGKLVYLRDVDKTDKLFTADCCSREMIDRSLRAISNINLRLGGSAFALPKTYTFLEMFGVGRVEHLNIVKRWQDNNPVFSLAVPVGISTDGSTFNLDLHQKFQGPHGLVAGMTGSGKSEFIITYILSLAVNFHPDEVAFVLIDYKGGGLTGAFDDEARGVHLPHLIATITNLDGATIQRSLVSIESELKRRQHVLNEARSLTTEGTIDIYSYQRMYRNKVVSDPMPHLFIICDEFAELKQQQPEFMDQLISIARIGRSLGVHLILATQKPAGVVNEQIRSNTKFRVCLKVQDKADSMDMLERPEAAGLRETGRFYLQVGYNEQFALGQSAWSGASYQPQDEVVVQKDESVQFIDSAGQSILTIKPEKKRTEKRGSQLLEVVKALQAIADEQGIRPGSLWKPALPKQLILGKDMEKPAADPEGHIKALIGCVDDPGNQVQFPLTVDFNTSNNLLVIGGTGSGKTTMLHTILRQLVENYSPQQFQFYALDFSSRLLTHYKNLPHCGGVLLEDDSSALPNFFQIIQKITAERKKLFSKLELSDFDAVNRVHPLPLILVIIDNFSGFAATKEGDQISYKLSSYMKDGTKYGIKYVITESHPNGVPSKVKQESGDRLTLHLRDKYEYGDVLNAKVEYAPANVPGRGLCLVGKRALEYQAAIYVTGKQAEENSKELKEELMQLCARYAGCEQALRLPVMDLKAQFADFCGQFTAGRLPLGYYVNKNQPVALPFKQFSTLGVYFGKPAGRAPIIDNLLTALLREKAELTVVKRAEGSVLDEPGRLGCMEELAKSAKILELTDETSSELWQSMSEEMTSRAELHRAFCEENNLDPKDHANDKASFSVFREKTAPRVLFFESYADFCRKADFVSRIVFGEYASAAGRLNLYLICCFEPDDCVQDGELVQLIGFTDEAPCILFGGKYGHQIICEPAASVDREAEYPFNLGLMSYQGSWYPLLMPCGETEEEKMDEDDKNIFDS